MKLFGAIINVIIIISILSACTKNEAVMDINVTIDNNDISAGQKVVFSITGQADFITFYNGVDSASSYSNYPLSSGLPVGVGEVQYLYNSQGTFDGTFIATSYGDWGQEAHIQQFDFKINVVDDRTGIQSFMVKKSGLGGVEYYGTADEENGTITVITAPGTRITRMLTTIITESVDSKVFLDGIEFVNKSKIDYSQGEVIYTVEAPDGTRKDWAVTVHND